MNKLSGMLQAVLLLVVANAWGTCITLYDKDAVFTYYRSTSSCSGAICGGGSLNHCSSLPPPTNINPQYPYFVRWTDSESSRDCSWLYDDSRCPCTVSSQCMRYKISCDYYSCDNQCEADSIKCSDTGGTWTNTGASTCSGYSCKINHCKAADSTWLSTSIAACTGSNNYAIVNTDSTCEHVGACCPNDSIPSGNTCKWRCDSVLTTCNGRTGDLFGGVLPDTSVSGQDTTFSYQCYYNCSHSPNPDSTVYLVEGNIVLSGPSDSIPDGIKSETFNSVRTTTGGVYIYDYLSPSASEYIDSIAAMKCVEHLWRCVINNKYVYWYDNQEVPAGCTNIVRVK